MADDRDVPFAAIGKTDARLLDLEDATLVSNHGDLRI
jgi:hypothetical protein